MGITIADTYYLKAKGAYYGYTSDLEGACEALNYALSYDEKHNASLCLLGEIYAQQLGMPEKAFEYFDQIIANDVNYVEMYPIYIRFLIQNYELDRAENLLQFALKLKQADKANLYGLYGFLEEKKENFKKALQYFKNAKKYSFNGYFNTCMEEEVERVKKKRKLFETKKSSKKRKKNKKKSK